MKTEIWQFHNLTNKQLKRLVNDETQPIEVRRGAFKTLNRRQNPDQYPDEPQPAHNED